MGKAGKVAKKTKKDSVEKLNKQIIPAKAKTAMKSKPFQQKQKKSAGPKVVKPKKNEKIEDEEETEDSGAELKEISKTENVDSENDESDNEEVENAENLEDSDSDDEEIENENDEEVENENDEEVENGEENDDDESEDNEQENENNSDDDAPDEKPINKKAQKEKQQPKKKDSIATADNKDRRVYVRRIDAKTTEDDIREHFSKCGEIEAVKISKGQRFKFDAVIVFKQASSCQKARKFHNTILNDSTILVENADSERAKSDEHRSVIMLNSDHLTKLEGSVVEEIFSECGEIDNFNVVCEKNVLAYITFKDASAVPKALELNGTTFEDKIKVEVSPYKSNRKVQKTKVFVKNIANGVTEEDLTKMFEVCGPVVSVSLRRNNTAMATAIVQFENEEGYCKAFLLHEEKLRGRSLFIEPFSNPKKFGQNKSNPKGKRPAPQKWKGGPPQKFQKMK